MASCVSEIFDQYGVLNKVLKNVDSDFECVLEIVLAKLFQYNNASQPVFLKNEERSMNYRVQGNDAFYNHEYSRALSLYNMAIMSAPCHSYSLALAFSNRSAVLFKINKFTECIRDIDICLDLPVGDLTQKLLDRKRMCEENAHKKIEPVDCKIYLKNFNTLTGTKHKTIDCASDAIKIDMDKIVASRNIEPGEVVIIEKPYASSLKNDEVPLCCHHCHTFSYNMIPCENCCFVIYCSLECREKCWKELHKLECCISHFGALSDSAFRVSVQAVLKAIIQSDSWSQLISSVKNVEKFKRSYEDSLNQPLSDYINLCKRVTYDRFPKRGWLFQCALNISVVIQALNTVPDLMPSHEKDMKKAMMFVGKQIMFHCEQSSYRCISGVTNVDNEVKVDSVKCLGMFPLIKLIKHSCNPNVQSFGYNNMNMVVTTRHIPKDAEIIMSYGEHFIEGEINIRRQFLFTHFGIICKCEVCRGDWKSESLELSKEKLTPAQREFVEDIGIEELSDEVIHINEGEIPNYDVICKGLKMFGDDPKSGYYRYFFKMLDLYYNLGNVCLINQNVKGVLDPYLCKQE